jgi:hypothetical protein
VAVAQGIAFFDQAAKFAAMLGARDRDFPAALAAPVAEALERTILPADCELAWIELNERVEVVLSLIRDSPSLRPSLLGWLARPAQEWLDRLLPYPHPPQQSLLTALELAELGVIDRDETAERLYQCSREQQDCLEQWLRVRWLAAALPKCFEGLRWERERERFEAWLAEALGEPLAHFDRWQVSPFPDETGAWPLSSFYWDSPETLRDLATAFEVQVDPLVYEQAYDELLEGFEEEDAWSERNPTRSPSRDRAALNSAFLNAHTREEGDVAALFERFEEAE